MHPLACNTSSDYNHLTVFRADGESTQGIYMPFDDLRVRVDIPHKDIGEFAILPNGKKGRAQRIKKWGIANQTIRVKSVRNRTGLVMEGSFNGFLNGHTVIGSMNLIELVQQVVFRVLKMLKIKPTRSQRQMIEEGSIKLERLDVVGLLRVDHLGGCAAVLKALDIGLAGSSRNRMVFPKETVVYHSSSSYWSLMAYDKAQHLRSKQPELWDAMDPRIRAVAENYLRVELRQFRAELKARDWEEVRDVNIAELQRKFRKRLRALLRDTRRPYPAIDPSVEKLSRALLLGLLDSLGVDLISQLPPRARRRVWKQLRDDHGIDGRSDNQMPRKYRRTLDQLMNRPAFPIRHGAPRSLRQKGLIALQ